MSTASLLYKLRRSLPWLPLLVPVVGAGLIIWNMVFTGLTKPLGATWPHLDSKPVQSGALPWRVNTRGAAESIAPTLTINVGSLDLPSHMLPLNLNLVLRDATVTHLRITTGTRPKPVPLTAVPRRLWSQVPVKIYIGPCLSPLPRPDVQDCLGPVATVRLGQLIGPVGVAISSGASVTSPVSVALLGSPVRYPSDFYVVHTAPEVVLESPVFLDTGGGKYSASEYYLPSDVVVSGGTGGLRNFAVTIVDEAVTQPMVIGIVISRPLVNELTVYVTAILPLILAIVLALVWASRDERSPFDLTFVAGLIAVMLAILPLRAVLVPADLGSESLTLVDDILLLGVMFIAGFTFWQYASLATKAAQTGVPPSEERDTGKRGNGNTSGEPRI